MWAESADDIESAFAAGKVASLVGVESGYAISSNMAVLRTLYTMGARYVV
jgi:membrane dipeptidase